MDLQVQYHYYTMCTMHDMDLHQDLNQSVTDKRTDGQTWKTIYITSTFVTGHNKCKFMKQVEQLSISHTTYFAMLTKWSGLPLRGLIPRSSLSIETTMMEEPASRHMQTNTSAFSNVYSIILIHNSAVFSNAALPVNFITSFWYKDYLATLF